MYVVTLNDYSNGSEYVGFVSGYGTLGDTPSLTSGGDDEHSHNLAVKTNTSHLNTITINVKNNDNNGIEARMKYIL